MMFRPAPGRLETTFAKHSEELVHQRGFIFWGRASEHAEQKSRFLKSGPHNLHFSEQFEKVDMSRQGTRKSETTFVNQLSILFYECGLTPRRALRGGISKVNFEQSLSTFSNKCPQNGSKNGSTAPSTGLGCPHIGPFVVFWTSGAR